MIVFLSTRRNNWECSGKFTDFSVYALKNNLFHYEEILHYAALRSEWHGSVFYLRLGIWIIFYTQRFFYSHYVFKGAKLAKFIRYEVGWKLMWDEVRDTSISITKFTEMVWNDGVFECKEEQLDGLGSALVFQFMHVEKNIFYYKKILHFATLRSEWQSSSL